MSLDIIPDEKRLRDLRRMKAVALGLLLLAALTYVVFVRWEAAGGPEWTGYVVAASEAAMVGAIADWFAVTALFRHPLGLPIPHTAIIPRKKDQLATSMADFVQNNFLSPAVVVDKVQRADPLTRLGTWLEQESNARRVADELAALGATAVRSVNDEQAQTFVRNALLTNVGNVAWGPPLGRLLAATVTERRHAALVTLGARRLADWLADNEDDLVSSIADQGPVAQRGPVRFAHEKVAARIHKELMTYVRAVRDGDGVSGDYHEARGQIDDYLASLSDDLREDPATIERVEHSKLALINSAETHRAVADVWPTSKRLLLEHLEDPEGDLRRQLTAQVQEVGRRLLHDEDFRADADRRLEDAVRFLVARYGAETVGVISDTVQRWDAEETSRKIEVAVGKDLQFIRINGTVVGALVGLTIHTVTQTLL